MSHVFSSQSQLDKIALILSRYIRLPVSTDVIPGAFLEAVLAHVRDAERLKTYDYVDIVDRSRRVGWSIKSTLAGTPVTWKRAKIPNQLDLITGSRLSPAGAQQLGNALLEFCNAHARTSLATYGLQEIGYARLIVGKDGTVRYFERKLCDTNKPNIFNPDDFTWRWSVPKRTTKKEQLQSLHGIHKATQHKWWAWHGLGENQLHFSGEKAWWPPTGAPHMTAFRLPLPSEKISFDCLVEMLESI